jgi:hypothetical protein
MIKPLRKRHLQIWTAIAVLLPLGIIFSWLVIPNPMPVKILKPESPELLPVIHAKKETLSYCLNIRTDKTTTNWQLEWKNKLALTVPSAIIFKASPSPSEEGVSRSFKPESALLIGRIEAKGDYVFRLEIDSIQNEELNLVIYDFIHDKIVDFITFKFPFRG